MFLLQAIQSHLGEMAHVEIWWINEYNYAHSLKWTSAE